MFQTTNQKLFEAKKENVILIHEPEICGWTGWKKILHHLRWMKPNQEWDKPSINWCRISSIHSTSHCQFAHLPFCEEPIVFGSFLPTSPHASLSIQVACRKQCGHQGYHTLFVGKFVGSWARLGYNLHEIRLPYQRETEREREMQVAK